MYRFQTPTYTRYAFLGGAALTGIGAVVTFIVGYTQPGGLCFGAFLLALCLAGLYAFRAVSRIVELDETLIRSATLGQWKSLRWEEIAAFKTGGPVDNTLILYDRSRQTGVPIPLEVEGYPTLLELLRAKCPTLWRPAERQVFFSSFLSLGVLGVLWLGFGLLGLAGLLGGSWVGVIPLGLAGLLGYFLFYHMILALEVQGPTLTLRYALKTNTLAAQDLAEVAYTPHIIRQKNMTSIVYRPELKLKDNRRIALEGFQDPSGVIYLILKTWLQKYAS